MFLSLLVWKANVLRGQPQDTKSRDNVRRAGARERPRRRGPVFGGAINQQLKIYQQKHSKTASKRCDYVGLQKAY
jgi:hypothetical protein